MFLNIENGEFNSKGSGEMERFSHKWTINVEDFNGVDAEELPLDLRKQLILQFNEVPFVDYHYEETLANAGIVTDFQSFRANLNTATFDILRAMMTSLIRHERFIDGLLEASYLDGILYDILSKMEASVFCLKTKLSRQV